MKTHHSLQILPTAPTAQIFVEYRRQNRCWIYSFVSKKNSLLLKNFSVSLAWKAPIKGKPTQIGYDVSIFRQLWVPLERAVIQPHIGVSDWPRNCIKYPQNVMKNAGYTQFCRLPPLKSPFSQTRSIKAHCRRGGETGDMRHARRDSAKDVAHSLQTQRPLRTPLPKERWHLIVRMKCEKEEARGTIDNKPRRRVSLPDVPLA